MLHLHCIQSGIAIICLIDIIILPFLMLESTFAYCGTQFTLRCLNQVITSCLIISPMGSDLRFGMPILFA